MSDKSLYAGAARRDITPAVGTPLFGYIPDNFSTSVNDRLAVSALCLSQINTRVIILSFDLGLISNEICHMISSSVSELTGISCKNVIISATHTHSAPNVSGLRGWGETDTVYLNEILLPAAGEAAKEAVLCLEEAVIGIETAECYTGINRRQMLRDGSIELGQNPHAPFDPEMTVISFRSAHDGRELADIVNYGCHGTSAGCNKEISRDWIGVMCDKMEERFGGITVFLNGAEGDIGPRLSNGFTTGNISYIYEAGTTAGCDAIAARNKIKEWRASPELKLLSGDVTLPYRPVPSETEVDEALSRIPDPSKLINIDFLEYRHLADVKELYEKKAPIPKAFVFPQTVVAIGPAVLVPFPFEFFVGIALRMKEFSPYRYTLCLSNCNGSNSYLPTRDQLPLGGYEVRSFISGAALTLADDTDQRILDENLRLVEELFKA